MSSSGSSSEQAPTATCGEHFRAHRLPLSIGLVAWIGLCWPTLSALVAHWNRDPDFSHGFLIPVISLWLLWTQREELSKLPAKPSTLGLLALFVSLATFGYGHAIGNNSIARLSALGILYASTWFAFGWSFQKRASFPLGFLLLAVPPPFFILDPARDGLKNIATRITADLLEALGIAARQSANVLEVNGRALEVADACSGIRSLMAIISTAVLLTYLCETGIWRGLLVIGSAIPVTVLINVLRILAVALSFHWFGLDWSEGTEHDLLGLFVFALSLAWLYLSVRLFDWLFRWPASTENKPESSS